MKPIMIPITTQSTGQLVLVHLTCLIVLCAGISYAQDLGGFVNAIGSWIDCDRDCQDPSNTLECTENGCAVEAVELQVALLSGHSVAVRWNQAPGPASLYKVRCSIGQAVPSTLKSNGTGPYSSSCTGLQPGEKANVTVTAIGGNKTAPATIELQSSYAVTDTKTKAEAEQVMNEAEADAEERSQTRRWVIGLVAGSVGLAIMMVPIVLARLSRTRA